LRNRRQRRAAQKKKRLKEIYPEKESHEFIDELGEPDIYSSRPGVAGGACCVARVRRPREEEIFQLLKRADLPETGQAQLHDGPHRLPFEQPVTVGVMYMMKLHHLVEDKIHAAVDWFPTAWLRSTARRQGAIRRAAAGEMEVWALEAYGAAYTLQEMLTVKF